MSCIVLIAIVSPLSGIDLPTVFITANGIHASGTPWRNAGWNDRYACM